MLVEVVILLKANAASPTGFHIDFIRIPLVQDQSHALLFWTISLFVKVFCPVIVSGEVLST